MAKILMVSVSGVIVMKDRVFEIIVFILLAAIFIGVLALMFVSGWELYVQFISGLNQEPTILGYIGWMLSR